MTGGKNGTILLLKTLGLYENSYFGHNYRTLPAAPILNKLNNINGHVYTDLEQIPSGY